MLSFAGGECAVATFAPMRELGGLSFAAIGLTSMLNAGGAVLECQLVHNDKINRDSCNTNSSNIQGELLGADCTSYCRCHH